ncbi:hypothetical protein J6O48_08775 [bacterium]|nr:hypothetical protein [bacterium]
MARFKADEVDNYGGQGGGGFFYLKEDKEVAQVRFMYSGIDDVEGLSVHQVEIGDKKRYVNCLREYNQPIDDCPFCREKMFTQAKLFIPIYDCDTGDVKIWERGKKFFSKISSLCARYPNMVSHMFEIERNGKKGDTSTTYEIYETGQDDTTLEDLPDRPKILGGFVLDKTADDMEYYLEEGEFPPEEKEDEEPVRRRGTKEETPRARTDRGRRTPANNRREKF